jgi:hypothetical protein
MLMAGKRCPFFFASAVIQNHKFPPTIPPPVNLVLSTLSSLRPFGTFFGRRTAAFFSLPTGPISLPIFFKMADEVSCFSSLACCRSLEQTKKNTPHCLA